MFEYVGIVGFGVMGTQIAQFLAQNGIKVVAIDLNEEKLKIGMETIRNGRFGIQKLVEKGKISKEQAEEIISRIKTSSSYEDLKGVELVIEAVFEDLELKRKVLAKVSEVVGEVVIGSNTSSISITKLGSAVKDPEKFLGIHFFNPAQIQRLVEIVKGLITSEETVLKVKNWLLKLGKVPIVVKDSPGFTTTRLGLILGKEAMLMLQEGIASPQEIDIAMMLGYGFAMGPIEIGDLVGLDTRLRIFEAMYEMTKDPKWAPPKLLVQLVDAGYLGDPTIKPGSKGGVYEFYGQERATKVLKRLGLR
ncbi:MAG: 3-hydroxyacyl-CoA dehydrogenase family protein [Archaeoglobaceae archaeon]|nr:3-hydroxyacyl-CoA dehydrogenase family protein [Archaeoglobaceae archaeon]MCX8152356.1 3-hydroxyacyl-CoA dehydrogenase family protein [Archaeoglobaceae archaeon]MDW8014185.1 3-hydroxyacyl-CoA dehydrogenase family protein [Archaeoglobaceae archaeon]